ncbi:MAG: hypothetical protein WDO19_26260 [Bacteroidota bacterium]
MKQLIPLSFLLFAVLCPACKSKESEKESFFPVLSFIKSQAAHVDTSLYQIVKLLNIDSTWDTTYIKREEFRTYAKDFLSLPDLTEKQYADKYEESKFFDASLNRVIITYTPKDKNQEIQREEITIAPGQDGDDKVKNIIVNKLTLSGDSSVAKKLLWTVDESFQVTTIIQKAGHEDSAYTMKITWQ